MIAGPMRKTMAALFWIAVAVAMFLVALFVWQDRLIYLPQRANLAQVAAGGLQPWPSAADFRGLVAQPPGPARGTVVVFHGNAGHAGHRGYYAEALVPLGWRVILAEYPGYGPRPGAVGEASLVPDAEETLALAQRTTGRPVIVVGESLGAGVAAAAVARQRAATAGLVLITPWNTLADVGAHHYPWLPVRWMLRDRYDSVHNLAGYDRPVVVAVAERDTIVPARFGTALHSALGGRKRLLVIAGGEHNDWPERVDAAWWRAVLAEIVQDTKPAAPQDAGAGDRKADRGR
jgi:alpha-beta hydrolase superfamily lysophospholipase